MKLYVWVDPYPIRYGTSMVFAIASSIGEAKEQAAKGLRYSFGTFKDDADMTLMANSLGEPDRIVDLPCAEWHEWEE